MKYAMDINVGYLGMPWDQTCRTEPEKVSQKYSSVTSEILETAMTKIISEDILTFQVNLLESDSLIINTRHRLKIILKSS